MAKRGRSRGGYPRTSVHTKRFNGKIYSLKGNYVTKTQAKQSAAKTKASGGKARRTTTKYGNFVWIK